MATWLPVAAERMTRPLPRESRAMKLSETVACREEAPVRRMSRLAGAREDDVEPPRGGKRAPAPAPRSGMMRDFLA